MSQAPLFLALHLVGAALAFAATGRDRPWLACALGFPVGLTAFVLVALTLMTVGIPYRLASMALAGAVLGAMAVVGIVRAGGLDRRAGRVLVAWTAAFSVVALALSSVSFALLSYDSHMLVLVGRILGADGRFAPGVLAELNQWGVFLPVVQSAAVLVGVEYLFALAPMLGLSFLALFAVAFAEGSGAPRWLVALVTMGLGTVFFFQHHFILIHNNVPTAIYLFAYVVLYWLAEVREDPAMLSIAFLCLTAVALLRVEGPVLALLFAAVTIFPSRLPRRALGVGFGGFVLAVAAWYVILARHAPEDSAFLSASRCWLVVALLGSALVAWLGTGAGALRRHVRFVPEAALVLVALALAAAIVAKPAHMLGSIQAWADNLVSGYWGLAWPLVAVLALLCAYAPRPPVARVFSYGAASAILLILLLAYGRSPYRPDHVGDSANRMMLHLLPLLFYRIGLGAAAAIDSGRTRIAPSRIAIT